MIGSVGGPGGKSAGRRPILAVLMIVTRYKAIARMRAGQIKLVSIVAVLLHSSDQIGTALRAEMLKVSKG